VLDFGVSKVLDLDMDDSTSPGGRPRLRPDSVVTKATDLLGSPSYMAPEQIASARDADAQSDIWSLGVILFRLISGKAPFNAQSLGELIQQIMNLPVPNLRDAKPDLPGGLEHVVGRCLERDRERRFRDVGELARALAPYATPVVTPSLERIAILGPALITAPPPSHPQPVPSSPSWSASGASAWTGPPPSGPTQAPATPVRHDPSLWSAVAIGVLAAIVIGAGGFAYVKNQKAKHPVGARGDGPAVSALPPGAPSPSPTVMPDPLPPDLAGTEATPAPPPTTSTEASASASAKPPQPQAQPQAQPRSSAKPRASASGGGSDDEIPTTRE
jgi:serine/threonine protein kinase